MNLFHEPLPVDGATFSPRRFYRYTLTRTWSDGPILLWILLNPSTADERKNDPTLRKAIAFSKAWGFGGLVFCNLFAFRSTDPRAMKREEDPVGICNDSVLIMAAHDADQVVCAWGNHGTHRDRAREVLELLQDPEEMAGRVPELWCMGTNQNGTPKHPLYLAMSTKLERLLPVVASA